MSKKSKQTAVVISQEKLAEGIYDLWIETGLAKEAGAGQFIGVYPKNAATLLPRPISICEVNEERMALRLVYRVAGKGTTEFSSLKKDDRIEILGILGNGYRVPELLTGHPEFTEITLYGGGIGIPPMLQLAKELSAAGRKPSVFLGYRDSHLFLKEDFEKYSKVYVATEDGSIGTKGNVLTALSESGLQPSVMMAWSDVDAAGHQAGGFGAGYSGIHFTGRAYGLWNRSLSWMCVQDDEERRTFTGS